MKRKLFSVMLLALAAGGAGAQQCKSMIEGQKEPYYVDNVMREKGYAFNESSEVAILVACGSGGTIEEATRRMTSQALQQIANRQLSNDLLRAPKSDEDMNELFSRFVDMDEYYEQCGSEFRKCIWLKVTKNPHDSNTAAIIWTSVKQMMREALLEADKEKLK